MKLEDHIARQCVFSSRVFGPGPRTSGICDHIRKELKEIESNPADLMEWVDVITLALDGAWRAGYTGTEIADAITKKLDINERRTWPDWRKADTTKAIEHDRSKDA